ncbi:MAG: hypothetical protein H3C54_00175 [Taibaiella sp.]|nr:hypothetical protein [Taibaiella sp.]
MRRGVTCIFIASVFMAVSSCKKEYYNCECAYLNEYEQADTLLISVRATNSKKAAKECAESEINIAEKHDFFVYCTLR